MLDRTIKEVRMSISVEQNGNSLSLEKPTNKKLSFDAIIAQHHYTEEDQIIHTRFLRMVEAFSQASDNWKPRCTDNPSNLDLVIIGCFAGAKNRGLVTALSILYEDYFPLRIAGDLIFKLVSNAL
jgi:hypothetical protein